MWPCLSGSVLIAIVSLASEIVLDIEGNPTNTREGHLGGSVVECLPLAQVMIVGSWDGILHQAPCREPVSPSA